MHADFEMIKKYAWTMVYCVKYGYFYVYGCIIIKCYLHTKHICYQMITTDNISIVMENIE